MKPIWQLLTLLCAANFLLPAQAATEFIADKVEVQIDAGIAHAIGNIEVRSEEGYFYLDELIYNQESGKIEVIGEVRFVAKSGEVLIGDYASYDSNTKTLLAKNARIWLSNKLQIVAARVQDSPESTVGEQVIASTCEVCAINPTPIWQIRADRILRDKEQQKIYFHNPKFELIGVPILALPALRIPGPNATRMSGFLAPDLIITNLRLTGIRAPYFWVIGPHRDLTITPYITSSGTRNIELEARQELRGGNLTLGGALSFATGIVDKKDEGAIDASVSGRYYLTAEGNARLTEKYMLSGSYSLQSDYDFAPLFGYSNSARDFLRVERVGSQSFFSAELAKYRPLSEANFDSASEDLAATLPMLLYNANHALSTGLQWSYDLGFMALSRRHQTDVNRFTIGTELQQKWIAPIGLDIESKIGTRFALYDIGESTIGANTSATRATPYAAIDAALPLVKATDNATHYLTPRLQLTWSDSRETGGDIPNTDSLFVEHDYVSLFSISRFTGEDRQEQGLRTSYGLNYGLDHDRIGRLDAGIGGIWRTDDSAVNANELIDINEWVGYVDYAHPKGFGSYARAAFSGPFDFSRAEIGVAYDSDRFNGEFSTVSLAPEPAIGFDDARHEINLAGHWQFHNNWEVRGNVQHNLVTLEPFDASAGLTYGNECVELDLGASWEFSRAPGIPTEASLELQVRFLGLNAPTNEKWGRQKCSY